MNRGYYSSNKGRYGYKNKKYYKNKYNKDENAEEHKTKTQIKYEKMFDKVAIKLHGPGVKTFEKDSKGESSIIEFI